MKRVTSVMLSLVMSCSVGLASFSCGKKVPLIDKPIISDTADDDIIGNLPGGDEIIIPDDDTDSGSDVPTPPIDVPDLPSGGDSETEPPVVVPPTDPDDSGSGSGGGSTEEPVLPDEPTNPDSDNDDVKYPAPPTVNDPEILDPTAPNAPTAPDVDDPTYATPDQAPDVDNSKDLETKVVLDVSSLVGNVVALPYFKISYNPSAALRPGAIPIGTASLPAWAIPVGDWNDAEHGYDCTDENHAKHFLSFDNASYAAFDIGVNGISSLFNRLTEGVSASDTASNSKCAIQVGLIDGQAIAENQLLELSAGKHTATLVATGAHGRQILINREFTIIAPPTVRANGDLSTLIYSTDALDIWNGVTYDGYGALGIADNYTSVVNRDQAGMYSVTLSVTDAFGQTTDYTRNVVVREYSKAETLAVYEQMQTQLAKSEWTSSSTSTYDWEKGTYKNDEKWHTKMFRQNSLVDGQPVYTFGFAADSDYTRNLMFKTGDMTGYAQVNDGAILFTSKDGQVSVKRTDPNYDGGWKKKANADATSNLLNGFTPTLVEFNKYCTTDKGALSAADTLQTYGFDASRYEGYYAVNDATTNGATVSLAADGNLNLTFDINSAAGSPYMKLMNEAMVEQWTAQSFSGGTITYKIDRETLLPVSYSVSDEKFEFHLKRRDTGSFFTGSLQDSCSADVSTYSFTENFSYTSKAAAVKNANATKTALNAGNRLKSAKLSWEVQDDGSIIFDDGSCSCAGDERFSDEGSIGTNAPAVPSFDSLTIPSNATDVYNWLTIGVNIADGEQYAPAAYRAHGTTTWTTITADTDLSVIMKAGEYDIKYYVVKDTENYTYSNRTISVVSPAFAVGAYNFDSGKAMPVVAKKPDGKIVSTKMTEDEFCRFLSKDIVVQNADLVALMSITDSNGNTYALDDGFDYHQFLALDATFTVRYIATNGGNYVVFERPMTAIAQVNTVGDEGSGYQTEGTSAPEFTFLESNFRYDSSSADILGWLYTGVTCTVADGTAMNPRVIGIRAVGQSEFTVIPDASTFDFNAYMTTSGAYEVRYYAQDAATGNFTYSVRTVTAFSQPQLTESSVGKKATTIGGKDYFTVAADSRGTTAEERAKILDGIELADVDGTTKDSIMINGEINYTPNTFSLIKLTATNSFGKTDTLYRTVYVAPYSQARINVSLSDQRTIEIGGKDYVALSPSDASRSLEEIALKGVTVEDPNGKLTVSDVQIDGEIDFTQRNSYSVVTLTVTDNFGQQTKISRIFYVREKKAPSVTFDVSLQDQNVITVGGKQYAKYYPHEAATVEQERAKILAGVTVHGENGIIPNSEIQILDRDGNEGFIDYSKPGTYSYLVLSVTVNGETVSFTRIIYVSDYSAPTISISNANQPTITTENGKEYACYSIANKGTAAEERAKILAGVSIWDEFDGDVNINEADKNGQIDIVGAIDYDKVNDYSAIQIRYTNSFGVSEPVTRFIYVQPASAPKLSLDLDGQPIFTDENSGNSFATYYMHEKGTDAEERAKILAGVSFTDEYQSCTMDDIVIEGEIDYSKANFSKLILTLENEYGKTSTLTRYIYVRPYQKASASISHDGFETETVSGVTVSVYRFDNVPSESTLLNGLTWTPQDGLDKSLYTVSAVYDVPTERNSYGSVKYTITHPYDASLNKTITRNIFCRNYYVDEMSGNVYNIYNEMESFMDGQTYFMKEQGSATPSTGSAMVVYSTMDHKPGKFYLENVSSGKPIFFNNVSFGRRLCLTKNSNGSWSGKFGSLESQDKTAPILNTTWGYAVNSNSVWNGDSQKNYTDADFQSNFGRNPSQLFGYPVNSNTCTGNLTKNSNGTYTVKYEFNTSDAAMSGYKSQVNTLSGQTVKAVNYANIEVTFDKNFRMINYHANEKYTVTTLSATTTNSLDYVYYYDLPSDFSVRKF